VDRLDEEAHRRARWCGAAAGAADDQFRRQEECAEERAALRQVQALAHHARVAEANDVEDEDAREAIARPVTGHVLGVEDCAGLGCLVARNHGRRE